MQINKIGWIDSIVIEGVISEYAEGGIELDLGNSAPKYVISVMIDGGYTGYYDIETNKLKVYASAGTEASDISDVKYTVILME